MEQSLHNAIFLQSRGMKRPHQIWKILVGNHAGESVNEDAW